MSNSLGRHLAFFVFVFIFQVFIFQKLGELTSFHLFPVVALILMLPLEMGRYTIIFMAFGLGLLLDFIFNTAGLYSSSLLVMAFFRRTFLNFFAPRDGYEVNKSFTIRDMGYRWFLYYFGSMLLIFCVWFFALTWFSWIHFFKVIYLTLESAILTLIVIGIGQIIFFKPKKNG